MESGLALNESSISVNDVSGLVTVDTAIRCGLMLVTSDRPEATASIGMPNVIATVAAASAFMTLCCPQMPSVTLGRAPACLVFQYE